MAEHFDLMVPGAEAEGKPAVISSPYDGSTIATVERVGFEGIETALKTAHRLYRDRDSWLSPGRRVEILIRAAEFVAERREVLALDAAREGGKPFADSLIEADRTIDSLRLCADYLRVERGAEIPMNLNSASAGRLAFTQHEPIGVVVAFSAFNHPLNLVAHQVGPAVAAGCPVIVKPAEATPLSGFRLVRILREAGLPDEWCQPVQTTDLDVAETLASDPRVGFFSFIGSARVGWMLRSKLAPGTRCALEHGGAAPVIVAADADIEDGLPLLAKGGFYHAGQVCVSVQRVFAEQQIAEDLAGDLASAAKAMIVGDPASKKTDVGPLIRATEVDRVHQWVQEAVDAGAKVLTGGDPISLRCYAPTVLFNPPEDVLVSSQEIFGPVVCVYSFDDLDTAIQRANAIPYAFQAGIFTRDIDTALRAARRLDAAAVMINDHTAFRVDWMPFAGLRESGLGIGGIPYTLSDMQIEKMIVVRSAELGYTD